MSQALKLMPAAFKLLGRYQGDVSLSQIERGAISRQSLLLVVAVFLGSTFVNALLTALSSLISADNVGVGDVVRVRLLILMQENAFVYNQNRN